MSTLRQALEEHIKKLDFAEIEKRLLETCDSDTEADIHIETAADIFGVTVEQVTPEMRRRGKTINWGIIYGHKGWEDYYGRY